MSFFGRGSRKLQRLFAREGHSRACLAGHKPIDPSATQLVLENNWPRVPVEQSGEASDMMRAGSLPARRRFELIRLAQRQGQLSVAELSVEFRVSADTIRRDLDLLSVGGFVQRTHGGAVPAECLVQGGSSCAQRNGSRIAEKTRIAQCASELIEHGESVIQSQAPWSHCIPGTNRYPGRRCGASKRAIRGVGGARSPSPCRAPFEFQPPPLLEAHASK